jgi:hypothetical protein
VQGSGVSAQKLWGEITRTGIKCEKLQDIQFFNRGRILAIAKSYPDE